MDLCYPFEAETFRTEIRAWLADNLPAGWGTDAYAPTPEERARFAEEWTTTLFDGGWICATWPTEYGGRGLSTIEAVVLNEEFARAGAPLRADFFGDTLVGPTILQWGSEEQKKEFLPGIMRGQIAWCQGFSEPDAGSDLAGLKTTAVLDGDEWVINGQKIWTTQAQVADYVFLLARTDPFAPQHAGISYLLVPMDQPGVEVRPITQISGSAEFNEVFFTDARAPRDNVVGGVNNGWKVAMTTLGFERGTSATTGYRRFAKELDQIIDDARASGRIGDPLVRQDLARAYSTVKIMEINGYRSLTGVLNGSKDPALAALSATNKMFWSNYHKWVTDVAIDLAGPAGQILDGAEEAHVPGVGRQVARA
ncbi:MAG: acyl-CoA dehydrogenase family protein, partial [Actinomycetota bacterium]|nr:acyl-CoA dehydrogenase family protein [Actinomycetota bacterium]